MSQQVANQQMTIGSSGLLGMVTFYAASYTSQIETGLRIASLFVGLVIGLLTLWAMLRKKRS